MYAVENDICPICGKGQADQDDPEWADDNELRITHRCPDGHEWHVVFTMSCVFYERPDPQREPCADCEGR